MLYFTYYGMKKMHTFLPKKVIWVILFHIFRAGGGQRHMQSCLSHMPLSMTIEYGIME